MNDDHTPIDAQRPACAVIWIPPLPKAAWSRTQCAAAALISCLVFGYPAYALWAYCEGGPGLLDLALIGTLALLGFGSPIWIWIYKMWCGRFNNRRKLKLISIGFGEGNDVALINGERVQHTSVPDDWHGGPDLWAHPYFGQYHRAYSYAIHHWMEHCAGKPILVNVGSYDELEAGDFRFEPEILTITQALWLRLSWIPLAAVLVMLGMSWGLQLSTFGYVFAISGVVGIKWLYRGFIRPTYVRIAPGVIQIVEFSFLNKQVSQVSYEMTDGMTAVIGCVRGRRFAVTFISAGETYTLPVWQARSAKRLQEKIIKALLSTAPIPPMSDANLID